MTLKTRLHDLIVPHTKEELHCKQCWTPNTVTCPEQRDAWKCRNCRTVNIIEW